MPHLLSEILLLHHSDIDMKSSSRKVQTSSTTDLWWQWHQRCSKLGFHHANNLLLRYCMCDAHCPGLPPSTLTTCLGLLLVITTSEVAQLPFFQSHSVPLTFQEARLNWGEATPMRSLKTLLLPQHSHFGLWASTGRQTSCSETEGIFSLQLCSFIPCFKVSTAPAVSLKLNLPNIGRRKNGIVCKDDWLLGN